jgi:ribosomal protein L37AE/L43A
MKCYWGCGWEGTPSQYSEHYNICPAKVCPKCGSTNIFFYRVDEIECLQCGNKWKKGEVPKVEEEKVITSKTFKTEEEFRDWLRKHKLTAEPRPGTGLFKNGDRVGSYFETDEGIQVDLAEDAKTWLIRDEVFVEVEAGEEMMVEKPIETPVEETGEETPEA